MTAATRGHYGFPHPSAKPALLSVEPRSAERFIFACLLISVYEFAIDTLSDQRRFASHPRTRVVGLVNDAGIANSVLTQDTEALSQGDKKSV